MGKAPILKIWEMKQSLKKNREAGGKLKTPKNIKESRTVSKMEFSSLLNWGPIFNERKKVRDLYTKKNEKKKKESIE